MKICKKYYLNYPKRLDNALANTHDMKIALGMYTFKEDIEEFCYRHNISPKYIIEVDVDDQN